MLYRIFTGILFLFGFVLASTLVYLYPAYANEDPECVSWSGIVELGPNENFLGGVWIKDDEGDLVEVYVDMWCDVDGDEPVLYPYVTGDRGYPMLDEYVNWYAPSCGSCYVKVGAHQVDDPTKTCESNFTLFRPCDDDPNDCTAEDLDACNVCYGDGSTCTPDDNDPEPTPTPGDDDPEETCVGVVDDCGVCNGDNSTCTCDTESTNDHALMLDSESFSMFKTIKQELRRTKQLSCLSAKARNKFRKQAKEIHLSAWMFANVIPTKTLSCGPTIACTSLNLTDVKSKLQSHAKDHLKIARKIKRQCRKNSGKKDKVIVKRVRTVKNLKKATNHELGTVPDETTICKLSVQ